MFQFMLVVGLVLAYYGYAVTKNPRIWGNQGRDAIKEENWNRYVRYTKGTTKVQRNAEGRNH